MSYFLAIFISLMFLSSCSSSEINFSSLSALEQTRHLSQVDDVEEVLKDDYERESFFLERTVLNSVPDILIVIDSSGSMYHRLRSLGEKFSHLLSVIYNYDWQIAFTTVDHGDQSVHRADRLQDTWQDNREEVASYGALSPLDNGTAVLKQKVLNKYTSDYANIFYQTLSHGRSRDCERPPYCTGALEQPLRSLKSAIERSSGDNKEFFRDNADLISLIITNEDERPEDQERATRADDVINSFNKAFKGMNKKFVHFNIMIKDANCQKKERKRSWQASKAIIGRIIGELATKTGGENIDLCSEDYGSQLEKISRHIRRVLENNTVLLKQRPESDSIQIDFRGHKELDWTAHGRKITFQGSLGKKHRITVKYKPKK